MVLKVVFRLVGLGVLKMVEEVKSSEDSMRSIYILYYQCVPLQIVVVLNLKCGLSYLCYSMV